MADFRSKSYNDGKLQIEPYNGPPSATRRNDFRSYSVSYTSSAPPLPEVAPPHKLKRGKSTSKSWSFNDPEFKRKTRVASYKVYSVEGKVKGSFRKSFRWLKDRYTRLFMDGGDFM